MKLTDAELVPPMLAALKAAPGSTANHLSVEMRRDGTSQDHRTLAVLLAECERLGMVERVAKPKHCRSDGWRLLSDAIPPGAFGTPVPEPEAEAAPAPPPAEGDQVVALLSTLIDEIRELKKFMAGTYRNTKVNGTPLFERITS